MARRQGRHPPARRLRRPAAVLGRLALTRTLREQPPGFPIFAADRAAALDALEQASRGMDEVDFGADRKTLRILVTGFDPFLLDRNLDQSNPSGVNALLLDGEEIEFDGRRARIETAMFPVRYADFDAGMVERLLSPWMRGKNGKPQVDLVATVSMGRTGFDLERFPGRRRSTEARVPDNLNVPSGASRDDPRPPLLDGRPIDGPEFVEFSLPAAAMLAVQAPYRVNDNRQVTVVPDTQLSADSLAALRGKIAVEGSGGGYLSNEISYRSVRLRDALGVARLPVGHIHTPAIKAFEPDKTARIVDQLRALLGAAAATLPQR
ncbi:hypothetical protein [Chitinimonas koreensis]|uniref:hypothetical protein n=1 Tax=Chitinimonas koreensis TaxID=356302 RepID=UPI0016546F4B|nr:hypothetical protein [Chitinimonas koreensis]QNM95209.1 hypothetical protein H9L41_15160 [Chitinimonas koreensis]